MFRKQSKTFIYLRQMQTMQKFKYIHLYITYVSLFSSGLRHN